ncbi:retrovirus-related Pol polyprotein from type-2 retrotransposable element R2DM [Nephila pilipes]|uniref:Retrovirus-related Pol polyprotein from type-2 retrotransposable element R2DM n=1 Tax=Nephila pilipes TaxID=299642 RepID=A0A8X6N5Y9_NEPPI|nr:retrovirus-related Pol polyprotein from type-2 retrotransposable element R2DM [Nephila pilipes]
MIPLRWRHWREAHPNGLILSRIYNICRKLKDIPEDWKSASYFQRREILQHWRTGAPYRYQILFTNYSQSVWPASSKIGQHLEKTRRSHTDAFLVWLDISNAFGSIPHEVLFAALKNSGVDSDFLQLIKNIHINSSTRLISKEGLTEPIALLCGVKQGCPLSGPYSIWLSTIF